MPIEHDTLNLLLKFLIAVAVSFGALCTAIQIYLKGRGKLLDRQEGIDTQRAKTQQEAWNAVTTHLTLLKDSVITLSSELKRAREVQFTQEKDIETLNRVVKDLRDTVGALSSRIREFLKSQVDSNERRTLVRSKKGP